MSAREPDAAEAMRQAAREVLSELMGQIGANGNGHEHANGDRHGDANGDRHADTKAHPSAEPVPQVPAPPVAAVLRPSTWSGPPVPGEVVGDGLPAASGAGAPAPEVEPDANLERVTIDTDEDLARFVRALATRLESPRERRAVQSGRVRFGLRRTSASRPEADAGGAPAIRFAKGAVTERAVRDAAANGARLVLGRGAVLTPLARDQARALGVEIEKEGRC
jgi:hypothetical protein